MRRKKATRLARLRRRDKRDRRLYGVVVECGKGCKHLVAVGKTYDNAWWNARPYGMMDSATTVRVARSDPAVKALLEKAERSVLAVKGVEAEAEA